MTKRQIAHAISRAIKQGALIVSNCCERCGRERAKHRRLDAHHHNGYDREYWLDVQWLCQKCHAQVHGGYVGWHKNLRHSKRAWDRDVRARARQTMIERHAHKFSENGRRAIAVRYANATPEQRSEWARNATANVDRTPTMCDCGGGPYLGQRGLKIHKRLARCMM